MRARLTKHHGLGNDFLVALVQRDVDDLPARAPALCNGDGAATVMKSCTLRMPGVSEVGAMAHPMRHPVTLYVFDRPLIVTVRSAMPGIEAMAVCRRPSKTMCS